MAESNLLEREELLATLIGHLEDARDGHGSMVLLAGEAGSGKTALARSYVCQVGERALAMVGACDPLSTPRPLSPLIDFAADPDSGLSGLFAGDKDTIEIFNSVLDRIKHTIRPIIMVTEDIHWADQATLDFLRFLGRRVSRSKAVVLCTFRDDEVGPDHPLRTVLGQLLPLETTHRLRVPSLSPEGVAQLAKGTVMDPVELHRITGGNAFYVTEVIAGGETLPPTVQDAVVERISRLGKGPRQVVEAVSIAPRSLEVERAMQLLGGVTDHIDQAVASGVILGDGSSLRFRHELARSAVEESIPPARRFALHRRILALLLEDDPPDHARLAHHAIAADRPGLVAEYAPAASREASARGAHKEAISFYEAALDQQGELNPDEAFRLQIALVKELGIVDRNEDALRHAESLVQHYRQPAQSRKLGNALVAASHARWRATDTRGAREAIDEAVGVLERLGPSRHLAYAHYLSSHFHMLARHAGQAKEQAALARRMAEETDSPDVLWDAWMIQGTIEIVIGEAQRGADMLRDAAEDARRRDDHLAFTVALGMLGSGGGEARLYQDALPALEESIEYGLSTDNDYLVVYSRAWMARVAFEQGRWDEAVELAELVDRTSLNREGISIVTARGALGRVRVRRGDPGARELLEEVVRLGKRHELQHVWSPICGLAEYHWLAGDTEAMIRVLENAYERALDTDSEWARGEVGFWMWKAGAIDAPPDGAAEPFELQMSGKWRDAAMAWQEIGCPFEVAFALSEGDEEALLKALSIFDSLGARPMAHKVRAELREAGVDHIPRGPTEKTKANPAGLTPRQLEVLELMMQGMTNLEIAEKLFLSKKTVEHHVSAIYSKLGVSGRAKAVAKANQMEITQP